MKERQQKKREEKARAGGSDISNRHFFFFFLKIHMEIYIQITEPKHFHQGHILQADHDIPIK